MSFVVGDRVRLVRIPEEEMELYAGHWVSEIGGLGIVTNVGDGDVEVDWDALAIPYWCGEDWVEPVFTHEDIMNGLIDILCERDGVCETIGLLRDIGCSRDELIELGFETIDIDRVFDDD